MTNTKEQSFKTKKRRWQEEEKRKIFLAWKESKLSKSEFCRQNNLSLGTFSHWEDYFKKDFKEKISFSPVQTHKMLNNAQHIKINLPNGLELNFSQVENVQTIYELIQWLLKCHP